MTSSSGHETAGSRAERYTVLVIWERVVVVTVGEARRARLAVVLAVDEVAQPQGAYDVIGAPLLASVVGNGVGASPKSRTRSYAPMSGEPEFWTRRKPR